MIKRGFIYGLIGLFFEVLWTGICSFLSGDYTFYSHTALIMLPVYGSAVFLEPIFLSLINNGVPVVIRGAYYATLIFACEYFSGKALSLFDLCPWEYTGIYNIEGVIRLDYAPLWFTAGLIYERVFVTFFKERAFVQ